MAARSSRTAREAPGAARAPNRVNRVNFAASARPRARGRAMARVDFIIE